MALLLRSRSFRRAVPRRAAEPRYAAMIGRPTASSCMGNAWSREWTGMTKLNARRVLAASWRSPLSCPSPPAAATTTMGDDVDVDVQRRRRDRGAGRHRGARHHRLLATRSGPAVSASAAGRWPEVAARHPEQADAEQKPRRGISCRDARSRPPVPSRPRRQPAPPSIGAPRSRGSRRGARLGGGAASDRGRRDPRRREDAGGRRAPGRDRR